MPLKKKDNEMQQVLDALEKAENGDYSHLIDPASKDENPSVIASAVNKLLTKTEKRIHALEATVQDLTADAGHYRNIIDTIEESYFEVDLNGNIQFFNERVCTDLGYTEKELQGIHFIDLVDRKNAQKLYKAFHNVFTTGRPIKSLRWEVLKKNKEKIAVEASVLLRRNEVGTPVGFKGIVREISERHKAEDELRRSEERYRTILEITEEGYIENDLQGNVIFANDIACSLLGYEKNRLIGMNYRDYLSPVVADRMQEIFRHIRTTGKPQLLVDYDWQLQDGTIKTYQMNAVLMYDDKGSACGFRTLMRDTSLYKQTQDALRKSEEKYRNILENMAETYLETDLDGRFVFFNESLCRILGYSRLELQGANYQKVSSPHNLHNLSELFNTIYRTGKTKTFIGQEFITKDGSTIYMDISVSLIRSPDGKAIGFSGLGRDVTQEVKNRQKIEASEKHLRIITENVRDVIWTLDFDLNYTYMSPSVFKLLGFTVDEACQMPFRKILPREGYQRIRHLLTEGLENYQKGIITPAIFEVPMIRKDGRTIWVEIIANFNLDEHGKPFEIVGITRDISERKKAAEQLLESEKRYRTITENVNDIVWIVGLDLQIRYVSPSHTALMGYSAQDVMATPLQHFLLPESYNEAARILAEELEKENSGNPVDLNRSRTLEIEVLNKQGDNFWLEINATFNRDADGKATEILVVGRDITRRRLIEKALADSEQRYRLIVENSHEIIWTTDLDFQYNYMSPSCQRITGYTKDEIKTMPLDKLLTQESLFLAQKTVIEELMLEHGEKAVDPSRSVTIEQELHHKNGSSIWLEVTASFIRNEEGTPVGMLMAGRDITEHKIAEAEKAKLEEQLDQAQKMETIGRLAGGIAHDFNNMLSVILGYVDLAKTRLARQHPVLNDITEIEKAAVRSRDMTTQLLAFSRKQIIEPRIIDLNEMVTYTQKALTRLIGEDIDLKFVPGEMLWNVKFDPSQIEQVLINLAVNARDAMPNGGKLTIETANVVIDQRYSEQHIGFVPGDYVRLTISDNGTGMSKDILQHIFEPFFTTKEAGKGTGLGLATVYGIVRQNEGFINVYSEPGYGSSFSLYLPRTTEAKEIEEAPEGEAYFSGKGNVLIVEDDNMVLQITQSMLETIGYTVTAAHTPLDAIAFFENPDAHFDLVITDVIMPAMSGKDLRDRLLTIRPDTKVLFMSGYTADVIAHHGVLEKGVHFLQKPFSLKSLASKVLEAMSPRTP